MDEADAIKRKKNPGVYSLTDEEILAKIRDGKISLISFLYTRYYMKVLRQCTQFTKNMDEAHDLAQDIFLKAFDHLSSFKGKSKFSTWLYSITHNHCIESIRKKSRNKFVELEKAFHIQERDEENEDNERYLASMEKLSRGINHLSAMEKEMLIMKYQHNFPIKALEKEYNISESAAKMRLKRAKNKVLKFCHS